jgi:hypothetical protein
MIRNLITLAVVAALGAWYYKGPYQDRVNPGYDRQLQANAEQMRLCLRGEDYKANATGQGSGDPILRCARRHKLFLVDGNWHNAQ